MPVEYWRMGYPLSPFTDIGRLTANLEEQGWDGMARSESPIPDSFAALSLAAASTRTIKVGTATCVPARDPIHLAGSMMTVQAVSRGRAHFSIGRGDGSMELIGRSIMPVNEFSDYLGRVMSCLRAEPIDINGKAINLARIAMSDPSVDVAAPKVSVAATGPRMIKLAARLADGVDFAVGADPERLATCISNARQARLDSGLSADSFTFGCFLQVSVATNGDLAAARDRIRGISMIHARFSAYHGKPLDDMKSDDAALMSNFADLLDKGRYSEGEHGFNREAMTDDLLDRFAIIGSPEECAERMGAIAALGFDRIYISTRDQHVDTEESNTEVIGRQVLPLLRA